MAAGPEPAYELKCSCNQYPWGRVGSNSISARLCEKSGGYDGQGPQTDFKIDEKTPYAEMWMGTYPVLPSYVKSTGQDLQEVLDNYPKDTIGEKVVAKFGHSKLPYLPKVLSIAKALPLQVHPNTDLSSKLHQEKPSAFTDPNHKPEIALALSDFEAFVGFKPLEQVAKLMELEPLKQFMPDVKMSEFGDQQLKSVVRNMLLADEKTTKQAVESMQSIPIEQFGPDSYIPKLVGVLIDQYDETDNGILVALVCMNYLTLKAGEGLYIPADGIHAYLSGDIIECMARSNNVLNTGFCPRPDRNNVDLFTSTLSFNPHNPKDCMLASKPYPKSASGKTTLYMPALSEFDMLQTELKAGEKETLQPAGGPSILLATKGAASMKCNGKSYDLTEGKVFFVSHSVEIELDSKDGLLMHTAFVE